MRKVLFCISMYLIVNQSLIAMTDDELSCYYAWKPVNELWVKINNNKDNLSKMAKESFYKKLYISTDICMDKCNGDDFKYCNDIAKEIEKSK